jgi:hypothetical protein
MNHYAMMQRRRSVRGLGAPIGLGDAGSDLGVIKNLQTTGDMALAQGLFDNAVVSYQTGGQLGAVTVGPEIDAQTNGASVNQTQQAWGLNGGLATINSSAGNGTPATQSDAVDAQGILAQMIALYDQGLASTPAPTIQPTSALLGAAQAVVSYFQNNPCTQSPVSVVTAFQTAYNAEGAIPLTVDGKYGGGTQGAVQRVLSVSGGGTAPPSCFGGSPQPGVTPKPGPGTVIAPASVLGGGMDWGKWALIAAALTGGGIIAMAVNKKHGPAIRGHVRRAHGHLTRAHHMMRHRLRVRRA